MAADQNRSDADMVVQKPDTIGDADFANYFCTYGYLYHQKDMLEDQSRMTAYHDAVRLNPRSFKDKVVLDVGTGSGILAIWAAQCGAKKVYAVEATYMATHAKKLIKANGLDGIIEVLQSTVEEVELPEKVDVIISEWMGYFLLRESMFDSVLVARDRWLKEGGAMFPSHAKMYLAPIRTGTSAQKHADYEDSCAGWDEFSDQTLQNYGVDMRALTETFEQEQREFFLNTSAWVDVHPSQLLGPPCVLKAFDLHTVTLEEMKALDVPFNLRVIGASGPAGPAEVGAFCGWFDVSFKGSVANPNETNVELTTAPDANGATHWGQQAFYLQPTLSASDGSVIKGRLELKRKQENQRLYDLRVTWKQGEDEGGAFAPNQDAGERMNVWHIE
jgi:protein arginine N-methyltransferase 1